MQTTTTEERVLEGINRASMMLLASLRGEPPYTGHQGMDADTWRSALAYWTDAAKRYGYIN